jgi:heptosyltransferase-1
MDTGQAGGGGQLRILIVKLSSLGDVVLSLPVAMAIRAQLPGAEVDWLVEAPNAGVLAGHPALSRVIVSPRHPLPGDERGGPTRWAGFWGALRRAPYDAVLDLQGLMKSAIFVKFARGGRKIGFSEIGRASCRERVS